jgi:exodeoxyribonuclease V alpha subunit
MELTDVYRQGADSSIISLAHEIKRGRLPANFTENKKECSFFECSPLDVESLIKQIVLKAVQKGFTMQDFQILAPMYRGAAGINALNLMLQNILNPNILGNVKEVQAKNNVYRIGDKVMQMVNDPELNVFNGDFGIVTGINYAKNTMAKQDELIIDFEGCEVIYGRKDWGKIMLSYACSIHKAQGSEFKMVILPLLSQFGRMLKRNLLYTAITRSRDFLIMLGEEESFALSVKEQDVNRNTYLRERLMKSGFSSVDDKTDFSAAVAQKIDCQFLTKKEINQGSINPMIGMEELTPFSKVLPCLRIPK